MDGWDDVRELVGEKGAMQDAGFKMQVKKEISRKGTKVAKLAKGVTAPRPRLWATSEGWGDRGEDGVRHEGHEGGRWCDARFKIQVKKETSRPSRAGPLTGKDAKRKEVCWFSVN